MSKTKKIVIASICTGIIVIGVILSVILVSIKRFSTYTELENSYNKHTTMDASTLSSAYHTSNSTVYENGTQIVKDNLEKSGIYSWKEKKMLVPAIYNEITCIESSSEANKSYFQLIDHLNVNRINIVDEKGQSLNCLSYDEDTAETYVNIKTKTVEIKGKGDNKHASVSKKFYNKKVAIASFTLEDELKGEGYHYEFWELTTLSGETYTNIYDMTDDRKLIQTIGITEGLDIDTNNLSPVALTNGDIRFISSEIESDSNGLNALLINIYDKNYNLKESIRIDSTMISAISTGNVAYVGNNLLLQAIESASEKDHDFTKEGSEGIEYYNYTTYRINLKSGTFGEIKFNYIINNSECIINQSTSLLSATKVKDKKLDNQTYLLINNKLQTRELDYSFNNSLLKLNDNRFLATNTSSLSSGNETITLIDKNYKKICDLGTYNSSSTEIFSTQNSIIINDGEKTYIRDMNGVIVKTYDSDTVKVHNIYNENKYMVEVEYESDSSNTSSVSPLKAYYLENLGVRDEYPIYLENRDNSTVVSGTTYYADVILDYNENYSLVIKISSNNGAYNYGFYNFDGDLLYTVYNVSDTAKRVSIYGSSVGEDYVIISFDGKQFVLDR